MVLLVFWGCGVFRLRLGQGFCFVKEDLLFFEQFSEERVVSIELHAVLGVLSSAQIGGTHVAGSCFLASHEGYRGDDHCPDIPTRSPALLVEIGEAGADGFVGLEPATWGEEHEGRRGEGVLLTELQQPVIESSGIGPIQSMETEVKV